MKVYFNHIPKCAGTSMWDWLSKNSDYTICKVTDDDTEESLSRIIEKFSEQKISLLVVTASTRDDYQTKI